jgi:hypothetical protein
VNRYDSENLLEYCIAANYIIVLGRGRSVETWALTPFTIPSKEIP